MSSKGRAKLKQGGSRLQMAKKAQLSGPPTMPKTSGLHQLPISSLVEDPKNERKTFRHIAEMATTIKTVGILEPITVVPLAEGKYQIRFGHRRVRAAKKAGLKEVPAFIALEESDVQQRVKSIISNVEREEIPPLEMSEALRDLLDGSEYKTQRALAKALGKHEVWVSEMLSISKLSDKAREILRTSEVPVSYDAASKVARVKDVKLQERLAGDIASGASVRDVRAKAKGKASAKNPTKHFKEVIQTDKAQVIVQFAKQKASKAEIKAALQEAIKAL
jgi:ParB family chromosome partitioning protein